MFKNLLSKPKGKYTIYITAFIFILVCYFIINLIFHVNILDMLKGKNRILVYCNKNTLEWDWIRKGGGPGRETAKAIVADELGNIYITGSFQANATFSNRIITSSGGYDIFIAKYNTNGDLKWIRREGGLSDDEGQGIGVDGDGNVYVSGWMGTGSQGTALNSWNCCSGNSNLFISKYDSSGLLQWTKLFGGSLDNSAENISVDLSGNFYISGYFDENEINFDGKVLTTSNGHFFIAKFNSKGELYWVKQLNIKRQTLLIAIDNDDNLYLAYNPPCNYNFFIDKYGSSGKFLWEKKIEWKQPPSTSMSCDALCGFSIDNNNNIYLTGRFTGRLKFDDFIMQSIGEQRDINGTADNTDNFFICKYNSRGKFLWAKQNELNGSFYSGEMGDSYTDANGNTYIAMTLNQTIFNNSRAYIYILKYNRLGDKQWEMQDENSGTAFVNKIIIDKSCNAYLTGNFIGNCTIKTNTISSPNSYDIFLIKLLGVNE